MAYRAVVSFMKLIYSGDWKKSNDSERA
jgi:hypothetical protein